MKTQIIILLILSVLCFSVKAAAESHPFFPTDITINQKKEIILTNKGKKNIDMYSADGKTLLRSYTLPEMPTGIVTDGNTAYITTFESRGNLHILDLETGKISTTIPVSSGACYPVLSKDKKHIYICNQFSNTVSEIDLSQKKVVRETKVIREPKTMIFSNDNKYLFVTNFLPDQRGDADYVGACVSVIDMKSFKKVKDILLANGSNALRDMCITPDGKYIYITHNLGRYTVPTSQLQQGWMNTSAFSVIDVARQEYAGTVLVDDAEKGAAGIWGIDCNEKSIFITHSGTHEISIIDHPAMLKKFENYPNKENLNYDLNFLYGIRKRIPIEGNGPRNILYTGEKLIIPTYFSDVLNIVNPETEAITAVYLNPERKETKENIGEKFFNDATKCFQGWQSCNGCHPGDARMDGLNWDLMNDGIGNPKNCKSLLYSHVTPPCMISGIRASAEIAVRAGYKHIQFYDISEEDADCVDAYLISLRPVPSPYLVDGELSEKAKKGKIVYDKFNCGECHSGPYFTDMRMHRIGDDIEFEKGWDTPTLIESWRTAPYLFDGRAAKMEDVFKVHKHGIDKKISDEEIEALTEYVNSL